MTRSGWTHYYEFWAYPSDLKIAGLKYDLANAEVLKKDKVTVYEKTLKNDSGRQSEGLVSFKYKKSKTHSWNHHTDVFPGDNDAFTGMPTHVHGKWGVETEAKYNFNQKKTVLIHEEHEHN